MNNSIKKDIRKWTSELNNHVRHFKMNVLKKIFNCLSFKSSSIKKIENEGAILIFRLDGKIGDSVTSTGFFKNLKVDFPNNKIIVVCDKNTSTIYRRLNFIDEVLMLEKGFVPFLSFVVFCISNPFYFAVNTSHILKPKIVFIFSVLKANFKLTFLNSDYKMFSHHVIFDINLDHVTIRYSNLLNKMLDLANLKSLNSGDSNPENFSYVIHLPDDVFKSDILEKISNFKKDYEKIVILNSFAGARLRNFNQETTSKIVKGLGLLNKKILILSIGSAGDLRIVENWIKQYYINEIDLTPNLNPQNIIDKNFKQAMQIKWDFLSDVTTLEENMSLIALCDLVITPDTSIVHIASAFNKKSVVIFREDLTEEKNSLIWAPFKTEYEIEIAKFDLLQPHDINTVNVNNVVDKAHKLLS